MRGAVSSKRGPDTTGWLGTKSCSANMTGDVENCSHYYPPVAAEMCTVVCVPGCYVTQGLCRSHCALKKSTV